jgi:hypothetical protein
LNISPSFFFINISLSLYTIIIPRTFPAPWFFCCPEREELEEEEREAHTLKEIFASSGLDSRRQFLQKKKEIIHDVVSCWYWKWIKEVGGNSNNELCKNNHVHL